MRICPNCKAILVAEGHYVPPSLGEEGFFICKSEDGVSNPPTKSLTVSDPFEIAALKVEFHEIQQRVEQMRFRVMLAESQITTHKEIQPTIETYNSWDEMRRLHGEMVTVYARALTHWRELFERAQKK